ncbi:MAG: Rrf2 family transcriptional regulator [Bacteroidetes bacterium]|nr:MAG: Rrf2 family transcriptional regulator [Bacteroidota bacterium]
MLSRRCTYGLQAALFLASQERGAYIPIQRISECLGLSFHFLTKVLQHLTHHGLLRSLRGPHGGVALARPPGQITLKEIVVAIDGPDLFEACVLGLPGCGEQKPCPLHEDWKEVRGCLRNAFAGTTLAMLVAEPERLAAWQACWTTSPDAASAHS